MTAPLSDAAFDRCFRVYTRGGHLLNPFEAAVRANVPAEAWFAFRDERAAAGRAEAEACRLSLLPPERRTTLRRPSRINDL